MNSKTKSLRTLVALIFFVVTYSATSQVQNKMDNSSKVKEQEEPLKNTEIKKHTAGERVIVQKNTPVVKQGTAVYLDEEDQYQGREKEILSNLVIDAIPSDFPKYDKTKGIKWYNEQIDNYYKAHPSILKESVRRKLGV